jgi:hypothetical protein
MDKVYGQKTLAMPPILSTQMLFSDRLLVEESGRWKLTQEIKQVPAHWESEWGPIIGASRKPLFRNTFRFAWSSLAFPPDEA